MEKLEIKYRTWFKGTPPKPIKLEIPGWAGQPNKHTNGDKPQPWHCPPFVEGSTYGLELCYPFDTECHVKINGDKIVFEGDFTEENKFCPDVKLPPFMAFAPGHFGMTSSVDIRVPDDYVLRLEPHPRFYTDATHTVPCCLAGHIQTNWWPRVFFVVFKNPMPGQTLIFRKGEAYGQILVVPKRVTYDIQEMTNEEKIERVKADANLEKHKKHYIKNDWKDHVGNSFSDKYKQLSIIANKDGPEAVAKFLDQFVDQPDLPVSAPRQKALKLFKRKK